MPAVSLASIAGYQTRSLQACNTSFLTTYTFSKAISDNPGFRGGGQGLSSAGAQNILNRTAEKGLADLDHRHRFTVASVYQLPFGEAARESSGM